MSRSSLRVDDPHHGFRGFLYVLLLSTGDVKVGRAIDPEKRLREHTRNAAMFRVTIEDTWISAELEDAPAAEGALIDLVVVSGALPIPGTRETFEGVSFHHVRALCEVVAFEALEREIDADEVAFWGGAEPVVQGDGQVALFAA